MMNYTWSDNILKFYNSLSVPALPAGIDALYPYHQAEVQLAMQQFFERFYSDKDERHLLLGINPGRFGAGVTGICFTDPIRLQSDCGIENSFAKRQELSSVFIYRMIEALGGAESFYKRFYISAISPIGFVQNGKNINYYDDKALCTSVESFAIDCMYAQLEWPVKRDVAFCIGGGKNLQFLQKLNAQHHWFSNIKALPHPRFVMQYRLKQLEHFIAEYTSALNGV